MKPRSLTTLFLCFLLFVLSIVASNVCGYAAAQADISPLGQAQADITAQWGEPAYSLNGMTIWTNAQGRLVGAFSGGVLKDYALFDNDSAMTGGTIGKDDTAEKIIQDFNTQDASQMAQAYDIGSGIEMYARITSDGYIVTQLSGGELSMFDCIRLEAVSILQYWFRTLIKQ